MLAALVAICMFVFFQTLDPKIPKWQLDRSLIGENPGLGFRPMPTDNEESTLIWFQGSNKTSYLWWRDNILKFLESEYKQCLISLYRQKNADLLYYEQHLINLRNTIELSSIVNEPDLKDILIIKYDA